VKKKSRKKGKLKTALTGVGKHSMADAFGVTKWRAMTKEKSRLGDSGGIAERAALARRPD
jgi:hypothetical protein